MFQIKKTITWWEKRELYLYWCYNHDEMGYKVGPLEEARLHKFNFRQEEVEKLRLEHSDFDKDFIVEESNV